jgi:N-acetylglucosaminyl-diphospho-decaprenol L-rhamnosyltransferase
MISVVVVNWNSGPLLEECILSIRRHAPDCEIVVVDNDSADSSLDFTGRLQDGIVLVRNRENLGFAAACNQGWRLAHGDMILFLNPDAECLPGSVNSLGHSLEDESGIWAAGGCLQDPSGRPQAGFNVRAFPTTGAVAAEMLLLDEIWPGNPWTRSYRMTGWDHRLRRDVDQPAAACLMVRRAVLESLGGFDERFQPAWFEDVDLCRRIHDGGGRIVFDPEARFLHHGAASLRSLSKEEFLRLYHLNQLRYFEKHFGQAAAARIRRLVIAGLRLRALIYWVGAPLRGREARTSARAFWRTARHFSNRPEARR